MEGSTTSAQPSQSTEPMPLIPGPTPPQQQAADAAVVLADRPAKLRVPGEQHNAKAAAAGLLRHTLPVVPLSPAQPGLKQKRPTGSNAAQGVNRQPTGSCSSDDTTAGGSDAEPASPWRAGSLEDMPASTLTATGQQSGAERGPAGGSPREAGAAAPSSGASPTKPRAKRASVTEILAESENAMLMAELSKLKARDSPSVVLPGVLQADSAAHTSTTSLPSPTRHQQPSNSQHSPGRSLGAAMMAAMGVPHLPAIDHHLPAIDHHHHHHHGQHRQGSVTEGQVAQSPSAAHAGHQTDAVFAPSPSMQRPAPLQQQQQKGSFHLPAHISMGGMNRAGSQRDAGSDSGLSDGPPDAPPSPSLTKGSMSRLGKGGQEGVELSGKSVKARRASVAGVAGSGLISGYYKGSNEAGALDYRSLDRLPDGVRQALWSHRHRSESGSYRADGQPDSLTAAVQTVQAAHGQTQAQEGGEQRSAAGAPEPQLKTRRSSSVMNVDAVLSASHRSPPVRVDAATLATLPRLPQLTGAGKA